MVAKARRKVATSELDRRLRAESPAYAESDSWEVLAPQAMSIVLSVRFDPLAARQLADLARRAHRPPSSLVRDWTLERLATIGEPTATGAFGESSAAYRAQPGGSPDDFEALRERYRPEKVGVLMIGESRPAGGTFFYKADSRLFFATREAWARAVGSAPSGTTFLEELQAAGVWLYDIAPSPVNRLGGRPRREAVEARTANLVQVLRETDPPVVVAIKRSLEPVIRSGMMSAGTPLDRLLVLPFPLYQWRGTYVTGLAGVFSRLQTGGAASGSSGTRNRRSGPAPIVREAPGNAVTQPVTPNDLVSGQVRLPQAAKPLLPTAKSSLTVVLRGERFETKYDPRSGPDRSRSGVLRIPRGALRRLVQPYERLELTFDGSVVTLD